MARSPKGKKSPARGKSPGRGTKTTAAASKKETVEMDFSEGANVMARWPGTNLYFKAKVTYVREDDGEYDVQYEDGTVFTIKAKDVKKGSALASGRKKTPSRSRSRGRSPGRRKSPSRTSKSSKKEESSPVERKTRSTKAELAPTTPAKRSARIAAKLVEISSDDEKPRLAPNPSHPKRGKAGFFAEFNFEWISSLFFMGLGIFVLISLHTLCNERSCTFSVPVLPKTVKDYWDPQAFGVVFIFSCFIKLMSLVPIGAKVKAVNGHQFRMNGFFTLMLSLAVIPGLVYKKIDLSYVENKYFQLMTSSIILAFVKSIGAFLISRWGRKSNANSKGQTGNVIVDFFNGKELNPWVYKLDLKMIIFRISMIGMALLNAILIANNVTRVAGIMNNLPVILTASFQIVYALDAMFFEEYYFFSHDAMNTGFGYALMSSYLTFPFLPTLVTRYLIARSPQIQYPYLALIAIVNLLGYVMFRSSENQRCRFAKNPNDPTLKHLNTINAAAGKKILSGSWWSFVRYPNYLGELFIYWSWALPAVCRAGRVDLLVYYLPIFATLTLLIRCSQQNARNRRKYGVAWDNYCQQVPSNIIPKVY